MILQNHLADCLLLILVYCFTQYCKPFLIVCKRLFKTGCDSLDILFTFLLLVREYGLFHLCRRNNPFDCCKKLFRNGTALVCVLWLAALSYNCIDKFNNFLVNVMGLKDRLKHDIFRNLIGSCFYHDYLLSCGSHGESQIRKLLLQVGRVYNKLSVNQSDLCCRTGTVKGDV